MRASRRSITIGLVIVALAPPAIADARQLKRQSKLDHALLQIVETGPAPRSLTEPDRVTRPGRVPVTVRFTGPVAVAASELVRAGAEIANAMDGVLEAYVPVAALLHVAEAAHVLSISPVEILAPRVTSQGSAIHNATAWHTDGFTGAGVRVGIIDVGFAGYAALIGNELPAPAGVRCYTSIGIFSADLSNCGSNPHGTGVAEAVTDVAPAITLFIATPLSHLDFRSAILWMADNGVRVINFSAAWTWDGSGDGTTPFGDSPLATVELAASRGITFVSAAGNEQQATWTGTFTDSDDDRWASFAGADELNPVHVNAGDRLVVQMRWDDSWSTAQRDLDLYILDGALTVVASSLNAQSGVPGHIPREIVTFVAPATGWYYVAMRRFDGEVPAWVQVQSFTGQPLSHWVAGRSIANPAESRNLAVLAVGAAHWNTSNEIAWYSSTGPTTDGRAKPDIVGVAAADSVTYGPGGFAGTSQATPHVSGLAALVIQAFPAFTADGVASYLKSRAQPRGDPNVWGAGLAFLPSVCGVSVTPPSLHFAIGGASGSVVVSSTGSCAWTASTATPWITITAGASGSGSGVVQFSVQDNAGGSRRSGTLTVAGQVIAVSQMGVVQHPSIHDVNGDGTLDLFWQHETDGWIAVWHMDGTHMIDARIAAPGQISDPDWRIVGSADFNGDGRPDLFWQHQRTRLMSVWYMDGATFAGAGVLSHNTVSDTDWEIRAIADLNGDSHPDLIWQHRTEGLVTVWLMNGVNLIAGRALTPDRVADLDWKIAGTADFNSDGHNDLLWRHQVTGQMVVWHMNGTTFTSGAALSPGAVADMHWEIRTVGDVNDDGQPDLVWQHRSEGWLVAWMMDGVTLIEGVPLTPGRTDDRNWRIAGPR